MAIDTTRQLINQIRNASQVGENTAIRVGDAMEAILNDAIEQGGTPELKTVNGQSLIGEGDIQIGSQGTINIDATVIPDSPNAVSGGGVKTYVDGVVGVVLVSGTPLAQQMTTANTTYIVKSAINMVGASVAVPDNCILHFNGGSLTNGTINLNGALLSGNVNILCDVAPGHPAANTEILVDWFGAKGNGTTDDSKHLLNAINALPYVGGKLIFGKGKTYLHGDGVSVSGGTGNSYAEDPNNPLRPSSATAANIGRDITLRFIGYDSLTISGNGSTILSNERNGICKHNAILFFGACNDLCVMDLAINGNIKERYTNGVKLGDYALGGSFDGYTGEIYDNWRNHVWVDSATAGYALRANFYIYSCSRVRIENVRSINSLMDGFYLSQVSGNLCKCVMMKNCHGLYSQRIGLAIGGGSLFDIDGGEYSYSGYYEDMSAIGVSSNSSGISTELEQESAYGDGCVNIEIHNVMFQKSASVGVRFSTGTKNSITHHCTFLDSQWAAGQISNLAGNPWKAAENNELSYCFFLNGVIGMEQNGTNVHHNIFTFDKNFAGTYLINHTDATSSLNIDKPMRFCDNTVKVNLDGVDSTYTAIGYVIINGNCILNGNYFENVYRTTAQGVTLIGQMVCGNRIIATGTASTNHTIRPNYNLTKYLNCDLVCYDNSVNGFTTGNINIELIKFGTAKISVSLPFDASSFTAERWYKLPVANAKIFVTSAQNIRYEIDIYYSGHYGNIRAVNYKGIDWHTALEATVYYKTNVAYLKLKPSSESTVVYEMIGRRLDFAFSKSSIPELLTSAPDVSTFDEMVNLSKHNDSLSFANIDALLTGECVMANGRPHWANGTNGWVDADGYKSNYARIGATSERPTGLGTTGKGFEYFDTDLSLPIWWTGSAWVKSDGTSA